MRSQIAMVLVTTLLCVAAVGAAASAWEYEFRPAKAEYVVYGGSLGAVSYTHLTLPTKA